MPITIHVPANSSFDPIRNRFVDTKEATLTFEHSLISISKWESKWHKPFFSQLKKTEDENLDYLRCMCLTKDVDPNIFYSLTLSNQKELADYIANPMTAKKFRKQEKKGNPEVITSDLIYFWMSHFNIPFIPCEKWHINRLMALIHIASSKNAPPKKIGKREAASQRSMLNAQRRAKMNSRG